MSQRGRNAGVTGLCDIEGTPQFGIRVWSFQLQATLSRKRRRGRGAGGKLALTRGLEVGSQLALSGDVPVAKFPMPATFEGSAGQVVLQFDTGMTCALQVEVDTCTISYSEKTQEWWKISATATITAQPVFAGWPGEQPAATPAAIADGEILEQNVKSLDPDALEDTITRVWDVVALTDNDAGEIAKLTAMIAAAVAPMPGMKLRSTALTARDAYGGGTITETWGRTSTGEDVVNEASYLNSDASGFLSEGAVAGWGVTPLPHGGMVIVSETVREYNDGKILHTVKDGLETNAQRLVREQTKSDIDVSGWASNAATAGFDVSAPAFVGLVKTGDRLITLPNGHNVNVADWGVETLKQKWAREGTQTTIDPDGWDSKARVSQLAAEPAAPAGLVKVGVTTQVMPDASVGYVVDAEVEGNKAKWIRTQSSLSIDPDGWESRGTAAAIGATPAAPGGLVAVMTTSQAMPNGEIGYVVAGGVEGNKAKWARDNTWSRTDASSLFSAGQIGQLGSAAAAPIGFVVVETRQQVTPDGTVGYVITYGYETAAQKIVREATREHLGDWSASAQTANIDGVAPAHASLVEVSHEVENLPNGKILNKKQHGLETDPAKWEREGTHTSVDPEGINDKGRVSKVGSAGTPAAGQKILLTTTQVLPDGTTGYVIDTGKESESEREIRESTGGELDPYEYEKWRTAETVVTSDLRATLATMFAAVQNNVEFHRISGRYLPGSNKAVIVTEYTKEDKILMTDFEGGLVNMKTLGGLVSVVDVTPINSVWNHITTDYCTVNRVTGTLVYRRRFTTKSWTDVLHYGSIGLRNNGELLGVAIGNLMYLGPKVRSSEFIVGDHVRVVDYILRFDSTGFVEDSRVGIGEFRTNAAVSKGFVSAAALGWTVSAPLLGDLSFIWT